MTAAADCFLLFQDVYYPGWKAYVDGVGTDIIQTDIGMRAVEVPAGAHRVKMKYAPGSIRIGLALTCLGVVLSAAYILAGRPKNAPEGGTTTKGNRPGNS